MFWLFVLFILGFVVRQVIGGERGAVFWRFFWRFFLFLIYLVAGIRAHFLNVKIFLVLVSFLTLCSTMLPLVTEIYRDRIGREEGAPLTVYLVIFFGGIISLLVSWDTKSTVGFAGGVISLPWSIGLLIYYGIKLPSLMVERKRVMRLKRIDELNLMVQRKVSTQLERIDELRSLENSIKSLTSKLKISFPTDYEDEVQTYINNRKVELWERH
jgi:hypothetical protein